VSSTRQTRYDFQLAIMLSRQNINITHVPGVLNTLSLSSGRRQDSGCCVLSDISASCLISEEEFHKIMVVSEGLVAAI
jgi:hypothetical protein